jgi:hypothetical protein
VWLHLEAGFSCHPLLSGYGIKAAVLPLIAVKPFFGSKILDSVFCRRFAHQTKPNFCLAIFQPLDHDTEFQSWANKVWNFGGGLGSEISPKNFRKDIILEFYDEAGQLTIAYRLHRCWVSESCDAGSRRKRKRRGDLTHQARK